MIQIKYLKKEEELAQRAYCNYDCLKEKLADIDPFLMQYSTSATHICIELVLNYSSLVTRCFKILFVVNLDHFMKCM